MRKNDYAENKSNFEKYSKVESVLKYGNPYMGNLQISFVIPTYKRADLLREAVASIMKQPKTSVSYEVIIIDNDWFELEGSETKKILMEYSPNRICYYQNKENIGLFGNWNRCLEIAKGKWIAMLHDDDLLAPDYMNIIQDIFPKICKKNNIALVKARSLPIKEGEVIRQGIIKRKLNERDKTKLIPYKKRI